MNYRIPFTPGWRRALAVSQASMLMVGLVALSFPMASYAADEPTPQACAFVSDASTQTGGHDSVVESPNPAWASIPDASWIWGEALSDTNASTGSTEVFTKTFFVSGTSTGALNVAADNGYLVKVNGTTVDNQSAVADNFSATHTYDVSSYLISGANTLEVSVSNFGVASATASENPAGLIYKLSVTGTTCGNVPPDEGGEGATLKVHIFKYLQGATSTAQIPDSSIEDFLFPMVSTWQTANLNSGATTSGNYELGNNHGGTSLRYAADTAEMEAPASYETHEVTSDMASSSAVIPSGNACTAGNFRLVGYRSGTSLEDAEAATIASVAPSFSNISDDQYVIVVNEDCDTVSTTTPPVVTPPTTVGSTIVVRAADLAATTSEATSTSKWFFYNDETDTVDNSLGSFVTGPGTPPLGSGSGQMTATGTERRNLATYQFKDVPLADITELSFSTYAQSSGDGSPGTGRDPYLHFNVDFNNSDVWQNRLVFVPGQNATVTPDVWQTWNATSTGLWCWSKMSSCGGGSAVAWPDGVTATYRTWNDIVTSFPNAQTRSSDSWLGLRVGEPYPNGFTGNVDNFRITVDNGTNATTTIFDFEPDAPPSTGGGGSSGGGGGGGGGGSSGGSVAGSSTGSTGGSVLGAVCPVINSFLREGFANDATDVVNLKNFLNSEMGSGLTVNGFFDAMTTVAVNSFQIKYWQDVLAPWVPYGLATDHTPTGYVYKTTSHKIEQIACPQLNNPSPQLP